MQRKATFQRARRRRDWRPAFLSAMGECCGLLINACKAAGVDRATVWRERRRDPKFAADYEEARQVGAMTLEAEATRRAVEGCRKLVLYKGQPVRLDARQAAGMEGFAEARDAAGHPLDWGFVFETEYSDALLIQLLKRHFPKQYREKLASVNVQASASASSMVITDEQLREFQERRAHYLRKMAAEQEPEQN